MWRREITTLSSCRLAARADKTRSWNAPLVGEYVFVMCIRGEPDTGFVLLGIFSDNIPEPSASADGLHWSFQDGAVIQFEPATSALKAEAGGHSAGVQPVRCRWQYNDRTCDPVTASGRGGKRPAPDKGAAERRP